ncbi:MAG TPA: hypothetical protein VKJ01_20830 [Candidatus Solibacter sp.]|nr:hypothetical protein [Candidatus Solibacter sp.]
MQKEFRGFFVGAAQGLEFGSYFTAGGARFPDSLHGRLVAGLAFIQQLFDDVRILLANQALRGALRLTDGRYQREQHSRLVAAGCRNPPGGGSIPVENIAQPTHRRGHGGHKCKHQNRELASYAHRFHRVSLPDQGGDSHPIPTGGNWRQPPFLPRRAL